jgi:hypothetical protein
LSDWISRKYQDVKQRAEAAWVELGRCETELGISRQTLEEQWSMQVSTQLTPPKSTFHVRRSSVITLANPIVGQSKYAGERAIEAVLLTLALAEETRASIAIDTKRLRNLGKRQSRSDVDADTEYEALADSIDSQKRELDILVQRANEQSRELGTGDRQLLQQHKDSPYIRARVNARALRDNIRSSIVAHKFEREKLERSYRSQIMRKFVSSVTTRELTKFQRTRIMSTSETQ